jgi:hypothetical protein
MDLYSFDPANGPAVPDLPPINIGALAIGLGDLFGRANGLVLPRTVVINETAQEFMLMFAPDPDSARVITTWAMRFGGVVESHVCEALGSPHRHICATFDYYGVQVDAYTFIPLPEQESQL